MPALSSIATMYVAIIFYEFFSEPLVCIVYLGYQQLIYFFNRRNDGGMVPVADQNTDPCQCQLRMMKDHVARNLPDKSHIIAFPPGA